MKTKLKFAEDIDVRPCAELRTSPSAANLFARSTWIRDNFLTKLSFLYWFRFDEEVEDGLFEYYGLNGFF